MEKGTFGPAVEFLGAVLESLKQPPGSLLYHGYEK